MHKGSCLCGVVHFAVEGELAPPEACYCTQCRKQSGHIWAATDIPRERLRLEGGQHLTWFRSSAGARRGFCSQCGSFLFWEAIDGDRIEIAMGAFDPPTGVRLAAHIFVAEQGDYYRIADRLPQRQRD